MNMELGGNLSTEVSKVAFLRIYNGILTIKLRKYDQNIFRYIVHSAVYFPTGRLNPL